MNKEDYIEQLKDIAIKLSNCYDCNLQIEINVQNNSKAKVTIKECNL